MYVNCNLPIHSIPSPSPFFFFFFFFFSKLLVSFLKTLGRNSGYLKILTHQTLIWFSYQKTARCYFGTWNEGRYMVCIHWILLGLSTKTEASGVMGESPCKGSAEASQTAPGAWWLEVGVQWSRLWVQRAMALLQRVSLDQYGPCLKSVMQSIKHGWNFRERNGSFNHNVFPDTRCLKMFQ